MINFSRVYLPFCLRHMGEGMYIALNRDGRPVGLATERKVLYADHPVGIRIRGLTPERIAQLSFEGSTDAESIFLYDESVLLGGGAIDWSAYAARLDLLSEMSIESGESVSRYVEVPGFPTFLAR